MRRFQGFLQARPALDVETFSTLTLVLANTQLRLAQASGGLNYVDDALKNYGRLRTTIAQSDSLRWSVILLNEGMAWSRKAEIIGDSLSARQAVASLQAGIDALPAHVNARSRISTMSSLGGAMSQAAGVAKDPMLADRSVRLLRDAISTPIEPQDPVLMTKVRMNLGTARIVKGFLGSDADTIRAALDDLLPIFDTYTKSEMPVKWAMLSFTVGQGYLSLGQLSTSPKDFEHAVDSFRAAETVWSLAAAPQRWVMLEGLIGSALALEYVTGGNTQHLCDACEAHLQAWEWYYDNQQVQSSEALHIERLLASELPLLLNNETAAAACLKLRISAISKLLDPNRPPPNLDRTSH
jgi:hypothetical protein